MPTGRYFRATHATISADDTQSQGYATSGGTLFAQKQTNFDDRSRAYQNADIRGRISAPAPSATRSIGNKWFDPSGNLLQSIGEGDGKAFTKQTYNGVNWVFSSYRGYNTSGTSYSQATHRRQRHHRRAERQYVRRGWQRRSAPR